MDELSEGWGWPLLSRKAHYFAEDGSLGKTSLCRKWLYGGVLEQGDDDSPDNCTECRRRLEKRKR